MPRKKMGEDVTDETPDMPDTLDEQLEAHQEKIPVTKSDPALQADKAEVVSDPEVIVLLRKALPSVQVGKHPISKKPLRFSFEKGRKYKVPASVAYHLRTIDAI